MKRHKIRTWMSEAIAEKQAAIPPKTWVHGKDVKRKIKMLIGDSVQDVVGETKGDA